jgi:hypothetical protein
MKKILDYLTKHTECLDTEISTATRTPLIKVHQYLTELKAKNVIVIYPATRYVECNKSEVIICRLVGNGAAGKAKPQVGLG